MELKAHIKKLRSILNQHNINYYVNDNPAISDIEYDTLLRELEALEKKNPEFLTADSPTQRIGGVPLNEFKSIKHRIPLQSLANAMNESELEYFDKQIMKLLDLGVLGIISPMINNREECEKFISYCYYPPIGQRSFGPMRAQLKYGLDYYKNANSEILTLAMIETQEAVKNLDDILSVPHLNGIYIGPADMSISYGLKPQFDVKEEPVYSNIKLIAKKAKEHGKVAGIHNGSTLYSKEMIELGYQFITISSDYRSMVAYAQNIVDEIKGFKKKDIKSETY